MDENNGLLEQFAQFDNSNQPFEIQRQAAHQELENQLMQSQQIQQQQAQAGPEQYATQGTIQQPPGPFMGDTYGAGQQPQANRAQRHAQFMQMDPNGQPQQIPNPYMTGQPIQPQPGMIQQPGMQQQSPYSVNQYQAAPMEAPYANDPAMQELKRQYTEGAFKNAIKAQKGPTGFQKGARIFANVIGPGIAAAFGDRQGAMQLIQQGQMMTRNAQARDVQNAGQAAHFLNTAMNMEQVMGARNMIAGAKELNKIGLANMGAQNKAGAQGANIQSRQNMQTQKLNWDAFKYADKRGIDEFKFKVKNDLAQHKIDVDMDQFERTFNQKERFKQSAVELQRLNMAKQAGQFDQTMQMREQVLMRGLQKDAAGLERDSVKFNGEMQYKIGKAMQKGDLPPDFDADALMMQFTAGTQVTPEDIGMDPQQFQGFMSQLMTAGDLGKPMQSGVQQRQGYGDAFTTQGTMEQIAGPPQQGGLVQPGAQMLNQNIPQPGGAPQQQQRPQPPAAMAMSKLGQQAMQRINQKYKPEEARNMLIQILTDQKGPYKLKYEEAYARTSGQ